MKNRIIFVLLLIPVYLQAQKMPMDYLAEGNRFYAEEKYNDALESYGYIIKNYDYSDEYAMAVYNTAVVYQKNKDYYQSLKYYKVVLKGAFDNQIILGSKSIMDNPYANFSYKSCMNIANIYFEEAKYDSALSYYTMADTSNLLLTDCGNEASEVHYDLVVKQAQCFIKIKNSQEAIKLLVGNVFSNGLASVKPIQDLLIKTLNDIYSKQKIQSLIKKAIQNINSENKGFYMNLFGAKIYIYDFEIPSEKESLTKEDILKRISKNHFFKTYLNN